MAIIDDSIGYTDGEMSSRPSNRTPLLSYMNGFIYKRRIIVSISIILALLAIFCSSVGAYFYYKSRIFRSFKSGAITHIERKYSFLESAKKISYVNEIVRIHRGGKISDDPAAELDILIEFDAYNERFNASFRDNAHRTDKFLTYRHNHFIVESNPSDSAYSLELNKFALMSEAEFEALHPPLALPKFSTSPSKDSDLFKKLLHNAEYLSSLKRAKQLTRDVKDLSLVTGEGLDWTRANTVSPVKDQSHYCGSCWAFASIASVESAYRLFKDEIHSLSEQELLNCERYSKGCGGGFPEKALEYIHAHGVSLAKDVPYRAIRERCDVKTHKKYFIDSIVVHMGHEVLNKSLVISPTVVGIAASDELKLYKSGIFTGKCGKELNHAVLLVGEGVDPETDMRYWIVKNSWGTDWGEDGYFRLLRNGQKNDMCGILSVGLNPILY